MIQRSQAAARLRDTDFPGVEEELKFLEKGPDPMAIARAASAGGNGESRMIMAFLVQSLSESRRSSGSSGSSSSSDSSHSPRASVEAEDFRYHPKNTPSEASNPNEQASPSVQAPTAPDDKTPPPPAPVVPAVSAAPAAPEAKSNQIPKAPPVQPATPKPVEPIVLPPVVIGGPEEDFQM